MDLVKVMLTTSTPTGGSTYEFTFDSGLGCMKSSTSEDSSSEDDQSSESGSSFRDIIDNYNDADFKLNFRLNRSTVEYLITNYLKSETYTPLKKRGNKIGARTEVLLYAWFITHDISIIKLSSLFRIAKPFIRSAVARVSKWLLSKGHEYIKWPQNEVILENCRKFNTQCRIPGVIGAIGCIYFKISTPEKDRYRFLVLQGVVDADIKFIDIFCSRSTPPKQPREILKASALYKRTQTNYDQLFPLNTFTLGGPEYPASSWIVPPFRDNGELTDQKIAFNALHSITSMVSEEAFVLLKERFCKLNNLQESQDLNFLIRLIASVCILHNFCIVNKDQYLGTDKEKNPTVLSMKDYMDKVPDPEIAINRRQLLFDYLCHRKII